MINQLDSLKVSIENLLDEKEKLSSEAEELRTARREAEEKAWAAEESVKTLQTELETYKQEKDDLERSKTEAVSEIERERDELRAEMNQITSQLERVSELYQEASAEKDKLQEKVDVSDLLAIYITLLETVFYGKPHARIMYTLHDVGKPITRKNLASSTGIQPAAVLKAIHDLKNADLVSYDEESQETALIKDILR
jgi:hypothetical protein